MKQGLEIKVYQDLQTDLNLHRVLTGSLEGISVMTSWGRLARSFCVDLEDKIVFIHRYILRKNAERSRAKNILRRKAKAMMFQHVLRQGIFGAFADHLISALGKM
jgi:hypothetical protein